MSGPLWEEGCAASSGKISLPPALCALRSRPGSSLAHLGSQLPGQPHQVLGELGHFGSMQVKSVFCSRAFCWGGPGFVMPASQLSLWQRSFHRLPPPVLISKKNRLAPQLRVSTYFWRTHLAHRFLMSVGTWFIKGSKDRDPNDAFLFFFFDVLVKASWLNMFYSFWTLQKMLCKIFKKFF